jgi:hypothetical protein
MDFDITTREAIVLKEALTEYKLKLRTIHSPIADDKTLTEEDFLSRDISENKRWNYLSICDMIQIVDSKIK